MTEAGKQKPRAEELVNDPRRRTGSQHSAEETIRVVLKGLRGKEGIASRLHYKQFPDVGTQRVSGGTPHRATGPETPAQRFEAARLKWIGC